MTIALYDLCGADTDRRFSPYCWRARMALAHKGVDAECRPTPFTAIKAINDGFSPTVPVIDHDGTWVRDSFDIALYLEATFADAPSLFAGEGGVALSRFVEAFVNMSVAPCLARISMLDIHDCLAPDDQAYFRTTREARFGKRLEDVVADKDGARAELVTVLKPVAALLGQNPYLGGASPLFADYILFGTFQWVRVASPEPVLPADHPLADWFERCLDLHGGVGRSMPAAA